MLLLLSTSYPLIAQWQWVDNSLSSANYERVEDVAVDDIRNVVYSVGFVSGHPSFPEIPGTSLSGGEDGFVMKYDLNGNLIWAFPIGGTSNDRVQSVSVDETTGNIYITGYIQGSNASNGTKLTGVAGGVSGIVTGTSGGQDAFVACYNVLGQLVWYRIIGGSGLDRGMDIAVNASGVYMTGIYTNNSPLGTLIPFLPFNGEINNFVVALNLSDGTTLWDAVLASTANDFILPSSNDVVKRTGISADANGIYLVTYFNGSIYTVYNSSDVLSASISDPNVSQEDFVVTSYTNTGAHNWSVLYDNVENVSFGLDITNDCSGVYVSGSLHHGGTTPGGTVISSNHDDFILSKLDKSTGNEIWLKEFNSNYNHDDHFVGIDVDGYGNLYAVGRLRGTQVTMGTELNYSGGGGYDKVMIAHFHTNGVFQNFEVLSGGYDSWAMSVGTYKNEKYTIGGYYNFSLNFGAFAPTSNSNNAFIATRKLPPAINYVSSSGNQLSGSTVFCQSEGTTTPELNVPNGGGFTGPAQVVFSNPSTGMINLSASTPGGPYTISYGETALSCVSGPYTATIYIVADEDASFTFSETDFCNNESNPSPASIVTPGGTFSGPPELVFANASTGEIDIAASTVGGPYHLVYTTPSLYCAASDSIQVYVRDSPDPSFGYSNSSFCEGSGSTSPIFVATPGGTFSAPQGIVFVNASTGEIDLNASTAGGTYVIQYVVSNTYCQDSSTVTLSITLSDDASFTYAVGDFCTNESNPFPTFVAVPGGTFSGPAEVVFANTTTGEVNAAASTPGGPYTIVYTTNGSNCPASSTLDIDIVDPPDASFAYDQSLYCPGTGTVLPSFIATPGGTFSGPPEIDFVDVNTGEINLNASQVGGPYSIEYTVSNAYCQESSTFTLSIEQTADASFSYFETHFCNNEANPIPSSISTPGGTFSASASLVIDTNTGEIDVVASTLGGPYEIVYTTNGVNCPTSDTIEVYIEAAPNPSFAYAQSSYCEGAGMIALPSSITTPGGTFSGPAGLVLNSTTGAIDIDASSVGGTVSIQYLVANTYCQKSTTFELTIIEQDNLVAVEYSADAYCISDANQTPVITGVNGGVFSGPASINIVNATTGEFSPSTSVPGGTYQIQYTTQGVCPDSVEVLITLYEVPTAYAGEDQELYFTFSSALDADPALVGIGKWSTLSTSLIDDKFNPFSDVTNLSLGKNTFVWTVTNGVCPFVSDEVIIEVQDLFIPQAVTPNNDGKNDFFELHSLDEVRCSLQIFNRWGQLIYENSDYQNEWYGQNADGKLLENDTYFYMILIDDSIAYNGYVVLKK